MTSVAEEVREDDGYEGLPFGPALPRARAHAHVHAAARTAEIREDSAGLPSLPSPADRARVWLAQTTGKATPAITAVLEKPGTLMHAQPPTFRQAQLRHHECASHYAHAWSRGPRVAYGYGHMLLIKAPLGYAEWATDSPLRGTIHVLLGLAVWLGLLLGGYL